MGGLECSAVRQAQPWHYLAEDHVLPVEPGRVRGGYEELRPPTPFFVQVCQHQSALICESSASAVSS